MKTKILFVLVTLAGCATPDGPRPSYVSGLDASRSYGSLTQAERVEFCVGWRSHVEAQITQPVIDRLSEEQQALNSSSTPDQCHASLPAYQTFRPYRVWGSSSCEDFARTTRDCDQATVEQLELASQYIADYFIELDEVLSCDLASPSYARTELLDGWETRIPDDVYAAFECVFVNPPVAD